MSLQFDGVGDAIDLGAFDVSAGKDELTLMCWIKPDGTGDDRLISKANGTSVAAHWWSLHLPSLTLSIRLKTGAGTTTEVQGGSFTLMEWAHAAMIYDGATMKLYKNAGEVASAGKTGNVSQDAGVNVRLADNPVGDRFFHGFMADARIYDRALSVDELRTIIGTQQDDDFVTDGLVHRWKLTDGVDGATALTAVDSVGGVNGTIVGAPVHRGAILKSRRRSI